LGNYLELKAVVDETDPKRFPEWYMQSSLLGVPALRIGYRNLEHWVYQIDEKSVDWLIASASDRGKPFDPVINMRRLYTILRTLRNNLERVGSDITTEDNVMLYVNAKGNFAWAGLERPA